jgi:hypothetical protein
MTLNHTRRGAVTVALAALAIGAPAAGANAQVLTPAVQAPVNGSASAGSCTRDRIDNGAFGVGGDLQGRTGGTEDVQCQGAGLQFIGPSIGQVASVMGPTIIGSTVFAPVQTSAGSSATIVR